MAKQGKPRDALVFKTDYPVPKPKSGEVLVRIHAAALNPVCVSFLSTFPLCSHMKPFCLMSGGTGRSQRVESHGYIAKHVVETTAPPRA